jgi:hypothetical protein
VKKTGWLCLSGRSGIVQLREPEVWRSVFVYASDVFDRPGESYGPMRYQSVLSMRFWTLRMKFGPDAQTALFAFGPARYVACDLI